MDQPSKLNSGNQGTPHQEQLLTQDEETKQLQYSDFQQDFEIQVDNDELLELKKMQRHQAKHPTKEEYLNEELSDLTEDMDKISQFAMLEDVEDGAVIQQDVHIQTHQKYLNFDWFSMQTRVRQMVHSLMNPFLRRAEEDRATVLSVKCINDILKKKVDELLFISAKMTTRGGQVEELANRMNQVEADRKLHETKIAQDIKIMQSSIQMSQEKVAVIDQMAKSFKNQGEILRKEVSRFYDEVNTVKKEFSQQLSSFTKELRNLDMQYDKKVKHIQEQIQLVKGYTNQHEDTIKKTDTIVETYRKQLGELYDSVQLALTSKLDSSIFKSELSLINRDVKQCMVIASDVDRTINHLEHYLDKYQCIQTQNQITEALVNTLPRKYIKRLKRVKAHQNLDDPAQLNKVGYMIPQIRDILINKEDNNVLEDDNVDELLETQKKDLVQKMFRTSNSSTFKQSNDNFSNTLINQKFSKRYIITYPDLSKEQQEKLVVNIRTDKDDSSSQERDSIPATSLQYYQNQYAAAMMDGSVKSFRSSKTKWIKKADGTPGELPNPNQLRNRMRYKQMRGSSKNQNKIELQDESQTVENLITQQNLINQTNNKKGLNLKIEITDIEPQLGHVGEKQSRHKTKFDASKVHHNKKEAKNRMQVVVGGTPSYLDIQRNNFYSVASPSPNKSSIHNHFAKDKILENFKKESQLMEEENLELSENYSDQFDAISERKIELEDLSEELQKKLTTMEEKLQETKDDIERHRTVLEMNIDLQKEEQRAYTHVQIQNYDQVVTQKLDSKDQELKKLIENVEKSLDYEKTRRAREKSDYVLDFGKIQKQAKEAKNLSENAQQATENVGNMIKAIIESIQISQALEIQDEIDRKSISLMGYQLQNSHQFQSHPFNDSVVQDKHNSFFNDSSLISANNANNFMNGNDASILLGYDKLNKDLNNKSILNSSLIQSKSHQALPFVKPKYPLLKNVIENKSHANVVSINKDCITCSNQSAIIMKGFKMACLSYQSSHLSYKKVQYSREQLIQLKGQLINRTWTKLRKDHPWKVESSMKDNETDTTDIDNQQNLTQTTPLNRRYFDEQPSSLQLFDNEIIKGNNQQANDSILQLDQFTNAVTGSGHKNDAFKQNSFVLPKIEARNNLLNSSTQVLQLQKDFDQRQKSIMNSYQTAGQVIKRQDASTSLDTKNSLQKIILKTSRVDLTKSIDRANNMDNKKKISNKLSNDEINILQQNQAGFLTSRAQSKHTNIGGLSAFHQSQYSDMYKTSISQGQDIVDGALLMSRSLSGLKTQEKDRTQQNEVNIAKDETGNKFLKRVINNNQSVILGANGKKLK
eukprot:403371861